MVFCLLISVLGVSTTYANNKQIALLNNGLAMDEPYGESGIPKSYLGNNYVASPDYYDVYYPYKLKADDIGGYQHSEQPSGDGNEKLHAANKNELQQYIGTTVEWGKPYTESNDDNGDGVKSYYKSLISGRGADTPDTDLERKSASVVRHGGIVKYEIEEGYKTLQVMTDGAGNKYYAIAIQGFFYNYSALDSLGKKFPGFWDSSTGNRGQLVDIILTDGTCIHCYVADANGNAHTNGGSTDKVDTKYKAELKLPVYKNMFQASNLNSIELYVHPGLYLDTKGSSTGTSPAQEFKDKYNLGSEEGQNQIAYYRMYNIKLNTESTDPQAEETEYYLYKRPDSVGTAVSYNIGNFSESANLSSLINKSSLVSEWEAMGIDEKKLLIQNQNPIYLKTRNDLSISEQSALVSIGNNIELQKEASNIDNARILIVFLGLVLIMYSILLGVGVIFDRINTFIDFHMVETLTFGKLKYDPYDEVISGSGVAGTKKIVISACVLLILGLLILSGGVISTICKFVIKIMSL